MGESGTPYLDMLSAELCEEREARAPGYRTENMFSIGTMCARA